MHILYALNVMENFDSEGFCNIIMNIFDVILEYTPVILPHALYQIELKLLIKFDALIHAQLRIPVSVNAIYLRPSPESLYGYIHSLPESPLVSSKFPRQLLAFCQDHLIFLKRLSY